MRAIHRAALAVATMLLASAAACGTDPPTGGAGPATETFSPDRRAVRIETTGCGYASRRTGSGVAVGDGRVVTAAHLVARADRIAASVGSGAPVDAVVTGIDLKRDLAVLRVPAISVPPVEVSTAEAGSRGRIVAGAVSGTVPFEVTRAVTLRIEQILGTERHGRLGYELAAGTATGDSGAGAYDEADRLIGIVFATGQEGASTWITSSVEIEDFLATHQPGATVIACDSEASRLDLPPD